MFIFVSYKYKYMENIMNNCKSWTLGSEFELKRKECCLHFTKLNCCTVGSSFFAEKFIPQVLICELVLKICTKITSDTVTERVDDLKLVWSTMFKQKIEFLTSKTEFWRPLVEFFESNTCFNLYLDFHYPKNVRFSGNL